MKYAESLPGVSFEDIWNRLSDTEKYVCCTRGAGSGWETFMAWNPRESYIERPEGSQTAIKDFVRGEQEKGRRIFGYLAYDLGYALHGIKPRARNDIWIPDVLLHSFDSYVACRADGVEVRAASAKALAARLASVREILSLAPAPKRAGAANAGKEFAAVMPRGEYARAYKRIKRHIVDGDIYQVNFAHWLEGTTAKSPRELWTALWERNHADFSAYIEAEGYEILSASPERFISVSANRQIDTFPIKGTRPRGADESEDERFKNELASSEKENAELTMITDLLRNDIGKVCEFGSVRVVSPREVRAFASVWHAYSHISGICAKGIRAIDALLSMFPGGSVTGCPKKRAMEIIDELEPVMRGVYSGSIGWIDPDDSAEFNIAIRTIIKKGEKAYLQVGGGIVYDSDEKGEYQETLDKAKSFYGIL